MTIEQISDLSQIFGVFGILASLVFVGLQIRQNARATRAQTQERIANSWLAMGQLIADHAAAFGAGLQSANDSLADLNDDETLRFMAIINAFFRHYENIFLQYTNGYVEKDVWLAWSLHMQLFFHQPGVQSWWKMRKTTFAAGFRELLEASPKPEVPTPANLAGLRVTPIQPPSQR